MELTYLGNKKLLELHKTAFLCSRTVSSSAVLRSYDWTAQLNVEQNAVVSGFQSKLEKDVLRLLNKRKAFIIIVLARKMYKELPDEYMPFMDDNRLLVISTSSVNRISKNTADRRNEYIAEIADEIIFGYIGDGSSLALLHSKFRVKSVVLQEDIYKNRMTEYKYEINNVEVVSEIDFDKNEADNKKKREEANVATLLMNYQVYFSTKDIIIKCHEGPDFLIPFKKSSCNVIGLEITMCYIDGKNEYKRIEDGLAKLCQDVFNEDQFKSIEISSKIKSKNISVIFNHNIIVNGYKKQDKTSIKEEFIKRLKGENNGDFKYVESIIFSDVMCKGNDDTPKINVSSNMMYLVPHISQLDKDPVILAISKKEKLLDGYKNNPSNKGITDWWLCIHIPNDAMINPALYALPSDFSSQYDKIFLLKNNPIGEGCQEIYNKVKKNR